MKRDFLTLRDLSRAELEAILDRAARLKSDLKRGRRPFADWRETDDMMGVRR